MGAQITFKNCTSDLESIKDIDKAVLTDYELRVLAFIQKWKGGDQDFELRTSGSTGEPKKISFDRSHLELSAKRTINHFDLNQDDISLICIDVRYIGGLMMLVRSLVAGMDMIVCEPSSNPFQEVDMSKPTFIAIVPLQLKQLIDYTSRDGVLDQIKAVIVGGASIDSALEELTHELSIPVYQTFGMTETASHFAVRRISGPQFDEWYTVVNGWEVDSDVDGRLAVNWGLPDSEWIVTNDMVEFSDGKGFRWVGRLDNVINSGGIKIHSEALEQTIKSELLRLGIDSRFFVFGVPDTDLGEKLVLLMEGQPNWEKTIHQHLKDSLPKFHCPRELFFLDDFIETPNGKIDRPKNIELVLS